MSFRLSLAKPAFKILKSHSGGRKQKNGAKRNRRAQRMKQAYFSTWGERKCSQSNLEKARTWRALIRRERQSMISKAALRRQAFFRTSRGREQPAFLCKAEVVKGMEQGERSSAGSKLTETFQPEGSESAPKATWRRKRLGEPLLKEKGSLWFPRWRWGDELSFAHREVANRRVEQWGKDALGACSTHVYLNLSTWGEQNCAQRGLEDARTWRAIKG